MPRISRLQKKKPKKYLTLNLRYDLFTNVAFQKNKGSFQKFVYWSVYDLRPTNIKQLIIYMHVWFDI